MASFPLKTMTSCTMLVWLIYLGQVSLCCCFFASVNSTRISYSPCWDAQEIVRNGWKPFLLTAFQELVSQMQRFESWIRLVELNLVNVLQLEWRCGTHQFYSQCNWVCLALLLGDYKVVHAHKCTEHHTCMWLPCC